MSLTLGNRPLTDQWIPPEGIVTPDFVIAGAMKSGTSTLQNILGSHPKLFIPDAEIHFFDQDDIVSHPDFNYFNGTSWSAPDLSKNASAWWNWYSDLFDEAKPGQLVGDYSTTYMTSPLFSRRIARLPSAPKIVVSLRHPTSRCYSQYWHMLRTGRATYSFEDTLRLEPQSIVNNSLYLDHFTQMLRSILRKDIHVVVFEDFLANPEAVISGVCKHIGVDPASIPHGSFATKANPASVPRFPALRRWRNRMLRSDANWRYIDRGPSQCQPHRTSLPFFTKILSKSHNLVNPLVPGKPPPINPDTKLHLDNYFWRRLEGIDDLLELNLLSSWFDD